MITRRKPAPQRTPAAQSHNGKRGKAAGASWQYFSVSGVFFALVHYGRVTAINITSTHYTTRQTRAPPLSPLINYVSYVGTIQGSIDDLHVDYLPLTKGLHQWYHGQSESLALFEKFPDLVGRVVVGGGRLPQFAREGEHVLVLHEDSGGAEIGRQLQHLLQVVHLGRGAFQVEVDEALLKEVFNQI